MDLPFQATILSGTSTILAGKKSDEAELASFGTSTLLAGRKSYEADSASFGTFGPSSGVLSASPAAVMMS